MFFKHKEENRIKNLDYRDSDFYQCGIDDIIEYVRKNYNIIKK